MAVDNEMPMSPIESVPKPPSRLASDASSERTIDTQAIYKGPDRPSASLKGKAQRPSKPCNCGDSSDGALMYRSVINAHRRHDADMRSLRGQLPCSVLCVGMSPAGLTHADGFLAADDVPEDDFFCYGCRLDRTGESLDGVARSAHEAQAKITLIKLDEIALFRRAIFAVTTRDPLPKERALRSILGASGSRRL